MRYEADDDHAPVDRLLVERIAVNHLFGAPSMGALLGSQFLQEAVGKHERFLALAFQPSKGTLNWLAQNSAATHSVRELGRFDGIEVWEFVPRKE